MDLSAVVEVVEPALLDRVLQGGVAAGTLVLAGVTAWLAKTTRDDVRASGKMADEATQQTKAAWSQRDLMNKTNQATRELVIETIKSRADARGRESWFAWSYRSGLHEFLRTALSDPLLGWSPGGALSNRLKTGPDSAYWLGEP